MVTTDRSHLLECWTVRHNHDADTCIVRAMRRARLPSYYVATPGVAVTACHQSSYWPSHGRSWPSVGYGSATTQSCPLPPSNRFPLRSSVLSGWFAIPLSCIRAQVSGGIINVSMWMWNFQPSCTPGMVRLSRISTQFGNLRPQRRWKPLVIFSTIMSIKLFLPPRHMFARCGRIETAERSDAVQSAPNRSFFGVLGLHQLSPKRILDPNLWCRHVAVLSYRMLDTIFSPISRSAQTMKGRQSPWVWSGHCYELTDDYCPITPLALRLRWARARCSNGIGRSWA